MSSAENGSQNAAAQENMRLTEIELRFFTTRLPYIFINSKTVQVESLACAADATVAEEKLTKGVIWALARDITIFTTM